MRSAAGVSLAPNATRCLASLGVLEEVRAAGHTPNGAAIQTLPNRRAALRLRNGRRHGGQLGRAIRAKSIALDLQSILAGAVRRHDAGALCLGSRVTGFREKGDRVIALTAAQEFSGDYLIAADGVRSAVRAQLHRESPPHFLGYVAWRSVVPIEALSGTQLEPDTAVFLGPGKSLLRYMLAGRKRVNIVMFARHAAWADEGWTIPADSDEIRDAFAGWAPEAHALIDAVCRSGAFKWGLFGRDALRAWGRGRVTLIGDAAHPMLPFLGQGAAMAIEDGVLLARALASTAGERSALGLYEHARYARTTSTVAKANEQGLRVHGYFADAPVKPPVPRDDFYEYAYDASTVALSA